MNNPFSNEAFPVSFPFYSQFKKLWRRKSKPSICRYYSRESIVSDVDYAPLLTSLLIGPCALEYTKVKSCYQQW